MLPYLCNDQKLEGKTDSRHSGFVFACVPVKQDSADINKIMDLELENRGGAGGGSCVEKEESKWSEGGSFHLPKQTREGRVSYPLCHCGPRPWETISYGHTRPRQAAKLAPP